MTGGDGIVAARPVPGTPRPYAFPAIVRGELANGLRVAVVRMPGRPLVAATLLVRAGAADEPPALGGAAVLTARALTEGTELRDAIAFTEAAERLGASLHAEAGWDATSAGFAVPAARLDAALELLAELLRRPAFPPSEVERLRDERLTDLLQAKADPRRRADEAFIAAVYAPASPYHRPAAGTAATVGALGAAELRALHARSLSPDRATLVVAGEVDPARVVAAAERLLADLPRVPAAATTIDDAPAARTRRVRVVHRPGSVQTELRVGHPGIPRRHPDIHAVSVMSAILGGLFNSRLNMNLREGKGWTYGAGAGFDTRRARGPFSARAAVNSEVTLPALRELLGELDRIREAPVSDAELRAARDYLVGVFPLRFETPGPVAGALAGLFTHDLPDDELVRYRAAIEAVSAEEVLRVAREQIRPEEAAIVLVGDHERFDAELEAARFGPVEVERDEPGDRGPEVDGAPGPIEDDGGAGGDAGGGPGDG